MSDPLPPYALKGTGDTPCFLQLFIVLSSLTLAIKLNKPLNKIRSSFLDWSQWVFYTQTKNSKKNYLTINISSPSFLN